MAVENSICIKQCKCSGIGFVDISTWDTVDPNLDIISTTITLTNTDSSEVWEYSAEEYVSTYTFTENPNFPDGEYQLVVVYVAVVNGQNIEYTIEEWYYNTCNIKCIIDKLILDIIDDTCGDCKNEKLETLTEAYILYKVLCRTIKCKDKEQSDSILEWLQNKLINYKCKNC